MTEDADDLDMKKVGSVADDLMSIAHAQDLTVKEIVGVCVTVLNFLIKEYATDKKNARKLVWQLVNYDE